MLNVCLLVGKRLQPEPGSSRSGQKGKQTMVSQRNNIRYSFSPPP